MTDIIETLKTLVGRKINWEEKLSFCSDSNKHVQFSLIVRIMDLISLSVTPGWELGIESSEDEYDFIIQFPKTDRELDLFILFFGKIQFLREDGYVFDVGGVSLKNRQIPTISYECLDELFGNEIDTIHGDFKYITYPPENLESWISACRA